MAKKPSLIQLDLFATAPPAQELNKKAEKTEQPALVNEHSIEETIIPNNDLPVVHNVQPIHDGNIPNEPVFADEQIVVRIKQEEVVVPKPDPIQPQIAITEPSFIKPKRGRKSFKEMDEEYGLINIPSEEELNKKLYYSISEVAKWFKVNTSLLRAWETEFDILKPRKNRKGDRLFRAEDIKNLQVIYYLLRNRKFSIAGAKKYLKTNRKQADTNLQIIQSLTKLQSFLLEMKTNLV